MKTRSQSCLTCGSFKDILPFECSEHRNLQHQLLRLSVDDETYAFLDILLASILDSVILRGSTSLTMHGSFHFQHAPVHDVQVGAHGVPDQIDTAPVLLLWCAKQEPGLPRQY